MFPTWGDIFEDFEETRFVFLLFHFISLMFKGISGILSDQTKPGIFHQKKIKKSGALFCEVAIWETFN